MHIYLYFASSESISCEITGINISSPEIRTDNSVMHYHLRFCCLCSNVTYLSILHHFAPRCSNKE